MSFQCPKCGDPLSKDGRCGSCGYHRERSTAAPVDRDANRCCWQVNGERCRYVATWSFSTLGSGPFYCTGHSRCGHGDGPLGERILRESREVPQGYDYSTEAINRVARERYMATRPTGGRPIKSAGCIAALAAQHLRPPADPEARLERDAIQAEPT